MRTDAGIESPAWRYHTIPHGRRRSQKNGTSDEFAPGLSRVEKQQESTRQRVGPPRESSVGAGFQPALAIDPKSPPETRPINVGWVWTQRFGRWHSWVQTQPTNSSDPHRLGLDPDLRETTKLGPDPAYLSSSLSPPPDSSSLSFLTIGVPRRNRRIIPPPPNSQA